MGWKWNSETPAKGMWIAKNGHNWKGKRCGAQRALVFATVPACNLSAPTLAAQLRPELWDWPLSEIQRQNPSPVVGFIFTNWRVKHMTNPVIHSCLFWSVLKGEKEWTELDWISLGRNKMSLFIDVWHQFGIPFPLDCCPLVRQDTEEDRLTAQLSCWQVKEMFFKSGIKINKHAHTEKVLHKFKLHNSKTIIFQNQD